MHRAASSLFMAALILCFAARIFKGNRKNLIRAHIITGALSIAILIVNMFTMLLDTAAIKYIGFLLIFISIAITGFIIKKNRKLYRKLHILSTVLFPVYLILIIIF